MGTCLSCKAPVVHPEKQDLYPVGGPKGGGFQLWGPKGKQDQGILGEKRCCISDKPCTSVLLHSVAPRSSLTSLIHRHVYFTT